MRLPIGTRDVSASGGTVELIGRRGDGWAKVASHDIGIDQAVALLRGRATAGGRVDPVPTDAIPSNDPRAVRFEPEQEILWQYSRHVEAARVVRDDDRGLVVWIPSGSERLESAPADGRRTREVPLAERFSVAWIMRQSLWEGPGVLRVAPTGMPWSVWFFREPDGAPSGAYVNLELPHRRAGGSAPGVHSSDLVLDLWISREYPEHEDVWLKDADELEAAVAQGRFTERQADAVRSLADHAASEFIARGSWPLDEEWDTWQPDAAMDAPVLLPAHERVDAARRRSGRSSLEG